MPNRYKSQAQFFLKNKPGNCNWVISKGEHT
jgi:hypothetical protein